MAVTLLSTSVYKELEHVHFYAAEKHCGQRHPDRAVHGAAEHLFARAREVRRKPDMANVSERAPPALVPARLFDGEAKFAAAECNGPWSLGSDA
jgi:hypothetical protein